MNSVESVIFHYRHLSFKTKTKLEAVSCVKRCSVAYVNGLKLAYVSTIGLVPRELVRP